MAHSFNSSWRGAAIFHAANIGVALLAAAVILIPGAPLLSIALNANVLATVLLPVALVFMVLLANDRRTDGPLGQQALNQRNRNLRHRLRRTLRSNLRHRLLPPSHPPHPRRIDDPVRIRLAPNRVRRPVG